MTNLAKIVATMPIILFCSMCSSESTPAEDADVIDIFHEDASNDRVDQIDAPDVIDAPQDFPIEDLVVDELPDATDIPVEDTAAEDPAPEDVVEEPEGPFFIKVSRSTSESGPYEQLFLFEELPYSLVLMDMIRDTESTIGEDSCTRRTPESAGITALESSPAEGRFLYQITNMTNEIALDGDHEPKKFCPISLFGDRERCEGTGRQYGAGVWVVIFNSRWGLDYWCNEPYPEDPDGDRAEECARRSNYVDTMKLETWYDRAGDSDCTIGEGDRPAGIVERYGFDVSWSQSETYYLLIEYN